MGDSEGRKDPRFGYSDFHFIALPITIANGTDRATQIRNSPIHSYELIPLARHRIRSIGRKADAYLAKLQPRHKSAGDPDPFSLA